MKSLILTFFLLPFIGNAAVWSIAHWSDCHAGNANQGMHETNAEQSITFILANTNDGVWNFRGCLNTGDTCEQRAEAGFGEWSIAQMTNAFYRVMTNGLFHIECPGNHDADDFGTNFGSWTDPALTNYAWNNIWPLAGFKAQTNYVTGLAFITNRFADDSRQVCMTYTNGGIKLVFVSYSASYTNDGASYTVSLADQLLPQTLWVSNQLASLPDYNGIVLTHYMLAYDIGLSGNSLYRERHYPFFSLLDYTGVYTNIGPSYLAFEQGLDKCDNLALIMSGHTRTLKKGHLLWPKPGGGNIDVQCLNLQSQANSGLRNGRVLNVLTFDTVRKTVLTRSVDTLTGEILPNQFTNVWRTGLSGGKHYYEHQWVTPLAVPKQKRIFRLP